MIKSATKKTILIGGGILLVLAIIVAVTIVYKVNLSKVPRRQPSVIGVYKHFAVSTNGQECAQIGADMLMKNGSAVDAAIAALLCEGVASLHSMGLGGGFLMTIWNATTNTSHFLDAREIAPSRANENMFHGNASLAFSGGLSIAVPGELYGYWEAHQRFGKLNWSELFQPTIELCETGSIVNNYLTEYLEAKSTVIKNEPTLAEILINPITKKTWTAGDRIKRPKLAKTLKILSEKNPIKEFYEGPMRDELVREIQERGGIIEKEDFTNYRVKWKDPITAKIGNYTMFTAPLPGSGVLLTFMLNVLEEINFEKDEYIMWKDIVETFKWAYAKRTELGDPDYVQEMSRIVQNLTSEEYASEIRKIILNDKHTHSNPSYYGAKVSTAVDSGTAHVSVLAPDGSAVSVTSTINQVFGSLIRSKSTGIIFNDEMDDFSAPNITNGFNIPPSPNNFIKPGKRPLSSMTPTIFINEDKTVRLVIGAAGGTKITTAVALAAVLQLWKGNNIKQSIDHPRIHHQLFPMEVSYEKGFSQEILDNFVKIGHSVKPYSGIGSAVTGIARNSTHITANSDYRREGRVAGS